jgi:uncharacterized protein YwqG
MAIGMTLKKANGPHDLGASKFFGTPTIPGEWLEDLDEELIFLAQIRLEDIAELDKDNVLPHTGYLYFFVDSDAHFGQHAQALVMYSPEEPDTAVDDFNEGFDIAGINEDWLIEFHEVEDDADGHKLLGRPYDWNYEEEAPMLLLQYDPLETEGISFMNAVDGVGYFFCGNDVEGFTEVIWQAEYS